MYGERGKAFYGQDPANGARRRRCQYEKARAVKPGSSFAARAEDTLARHHPTPRLPFRAPSSFVVSLVVRPQPKCRPACSSLGALLPTMWTSVAVMTLTWEFWAFLSATNSTPWGDPNPGKLAADTSGVKTPVLGSICPNAPKLPTEA